MSRAGFIAGLILRSEQRLRHLFGWLAYKRPINEQLQDQMAHMEIWPSEKRRVRRMPK